MISPGSVRSARTDRLLIMKYRYTTPGNDMAHELIRASLDSGFRIIGTPEDPVEHGHTWAMLLLFSDRWTRLDSSTVFEGRGDGYRWEVELRALATSPLPREGST